MTDIAELRRMYEAGSPGTWYVSDNPYYSEIRSDVDEIRQIGDMCASVHVGGVDGDNRMLSHANAELACAARNAIPAILTELEELRAEVECLRDK